MTVGGAWSEAHVAQVVALVALVALFVLVAIVLEKKRERKKPNKTQEVRICHEKVKLTPGMQA